MNKSANVGGVASTAFQPETNPQVEDMVKMAYANLTQEETAMADTLGMMEAANTVKQASYIQDQLSRGDNNMYGYNPYFQGKYASTESDLALIAGLKSKPSVNNYQPGKAHVAGDTLSNANTITGAEYRKLKQQATVNPEVGIVNKVKQHLIDRGYGRAGMAGTERELLMGGLKSYGAHAAGGAAALGLGAGGVHLALKRRAAAIQKAKLEQGLGRKVLSHLSRHGGKYAVGAGLAGLGGIALANKSASEDEMLWQHAAETGEAFLSKLASEAYDNALVEQLSLFRESAIESIDPNAFY
jgi:hypothetical protein